MEHLSPIRHIPDKAPALMVVAGGKETDEFIRQSRDFLSAWQDKGLRGNWLNVSDAHHFNILDGLRILEVPCSKQLSTSLLTDLHELRKTNE